MVSSLKQCPLHILHFVLLQSGLGLYKQTGLRSLRNPDIEHRSLGVLPRASRTVALLTLLNASTCKAWLGIRVNRCRSRASPGSGIRQLVLFQHRRAEINPITTSDGKSTRITNVRLFTSERFDGNGTLRCVSPSATSRARGTSRSGMRSKWRRVLIAVSLFLVVCKPQLNTDHRHVTARFPGCGENS